MLQHVQGSSWTVDYYSQVVGEETELGPQQLDRGSVYQQYCLINNMELKVTAPLTNAQDPTTQSFDTTGAAVTHSRFIPNKGDMFLADIGDGRLGRFTVTLAEKKSYHKDALYTIEYKLLDYIDDAHMEDLTEKTVKRTIFVKDFLQFGQNPQVLAEDFERMISFEDSYGRLLSQYIRDFFSREYQTLMVPDQVGPTYDPFLTKSILDWVSTSDNPMVAKIKLPRVTGDEAMSQITVWDCLARMDRTLLPQTMYRSKLLNTSWFRNQPHQSGIYFSGIKNVVYPVDTRTDVDVDHEGEILNDAGTPLLEGDERHPDPVRNEDDPLHGDSYTVPETGLPDIVQVDVDDYYVFSEQFYRPLGAQSSNLEKLVMDALEQESLDTALLSKLVLAAPKWRNLERFYYIPALLALLKVAIRTN